MNWPAILFAFALLSFILIVVGNVFAAFGFAILTLEAVAVAGWAITKSSHDALQNKDNDGPHI